VTEDLGAVVSYLAVAEGTRVYDRDGERIGVVEHVLAEDDADIFEGLIIHTLPLPGRHLFADVEQVAELHERGVLLSVARADLHEPGEETRTRTRAAGGDESLESRLQARLRRAWDRIAGRG
jgi:uncharacterized protein YrrD